MHLFTNLARPNLASNHFTDGISLEIGIATLNDLCLIVSKIDSSGDTSHLHPILLSRSLLSLTASY